MSSTRCFYKQELPAELTILSILYPVLQDWCQAGRLSFADEHRAMVAVTEAVTNAIIHAEVPEGENAVYVGLWIEDGHLRADIGDRGQWGWTPPAPPTVDQWERTGGRGLELIRLLASSYEIRRRPEGGTMVSMTFGTQKVQYTGDHGAASLRSA